jgi:hypothetical protein
MRGLILAIVASSAIVAFAPSSQASPLSPAGGITAALDDGATQVYWRRYHHRHWGYYHHRHYGWRHRCWRHRWC